MPGGVGGKAREGFPIPIKRGWFSFLIFLDRIEEKKKTIPFCPLILGCYPHLVLNPVPPLGHENDIASSGQTYQHDPHSMHRSRFRILAFPCTISKHPARHTFTQFPHPVQASVSTEMKLPSPSTHSTPGKSRDVRTGLVFISRATPRRVKDLFAPGAPPLTDSNAPSMAQTASGHRCRSVR